MVNQEIFSGLLSALSRKEPLKRAMMTFYNAGYKKEEIEEAAKALYAKSKQKSIQRQMPLSNAPKTSLPKKQITKTQKIHPFKKTFAKKKPVPLKKSVQMKPAIKKKSPQLVSSYGQKRSGNNDEIKSKISKAIDYLKQIEEPSSIKNSTSEIQSQPPKAMQNVSKYQGKPPKHFNKPLAIFLIIILILIVGGIISVLFFREEIIEIFDRINFG